VSRQVPTVVPVGVSITLRGTMGIFHRIRTSLSWNFIKSFPLHSSSSLSLSLTFCLYSLLLFTHSLVPSFRQKLFSFFAVHKKRRLSLQYIYFPFLSHVRMYFPSRLGYNQKWRGSYTQHKKWSTWLSLYRELGYYMSLRAPKCIHARCFSNLLSTTQSRFPFSFFPLLSKS